MTQIPLTPESGGGQCIPVSTLQPADIIVSTTGATTSRVIRAATRSQVSHASLYVGQGRVIEAIEEGVVERSVLQSVADSRLAVAYRHRGMNGSKATRILGFVRAQRGRGYDTGGAVGGGARVNMATCAASGSLFVLVVCFVAAHGGFESEDRFYCSELVLEAFQRAGVPLVDVSPNVSVPQDVITAYSHGKLGYVGHLKTP